MTDHFDQRFEKRGTPGAFYVLDRETNEVVFRHKWSIVAVKRARVLNVELGACTQCYGDGTVIADYIYGPDGDLPIAGVCPRCGGSGWEPEATRPARRN